MEAQIGLDVMNKYNEEQGERGKRGYTRRAAAAVIVRDLCR